MKYLFLFILGLFLYWGCKKEKYGNTHLKIKATSNAYTSKRSLKRSVELRYTQFGDFITSLTPDSFIGEFYNVSYRKDSMLENAPTIMNLIQHFNQENPTRVDFIKNPTITVIPKLYGGTTPFFENEDGQGGFYTVDVTFKILSMQMGLKQEIKLPQEYANIKLTQFVNFPQYSSQSGNVLTSSLYPMNKIVSELEAFNNTISLYFGQTDSTYTSYRSFLGNAIGPNIRSSKYEEWTMKPPINGINKSYISTIGFSNDNIIQLYAGADNIPYTSDDVVVLEPKFWERVYVYVDEN
jgi:hypothetical protein